MVFGLLLILLFSERHSFPLTMYPIQFHLLISDRHSFPLTMYPFQFHRLLLMTAGVSSITVTVIICWPHLILSRFLKHFVWNTSRCFSSVFAIFLVLVHISARVLLIFKRMNFYFPPYSYGAPSFRP